MATKFITLSLLLFIAATSIFSTCNKGGIGGCANTRYSFQVGVKAYPDADSIRKGDTLFFEIETPSTLMDSLSGDMIDYSGAENLGSDIAIEKIETPTTFEGGTIFFDFVIIDGKEVSNPNPSLIKEYLFNEQGGYYIFKLGVIAKEKGTYAIIFGNAANVYRSSDKCTKASFEINFASTNQHYYLNPNSDGYVGQGGDYYFKVY